MNEHPTCPRCGSYMKQRESLCYGIAEYYCPQCSLCCSVVEWYSLGLINTVLQYEYKHDEYSERPLKVWEK
jgi:hypothetical protein